MSDTICEIVPCYVSTDAAYIVCHQGRVTQCVCQHLSGDMCVLLVRATQDAKDRGKPLPERETCWIAWGIE
jgi:hypothetical protein